MTYPVLFFNEKDGRLMPSFITHVCPSGRSNEYLLRNIRGERFGIIGTQAIDMAGSSHQTTAYPEPAIAIKLHARTSLPFS
jgi:hypothetical protein